MAGTGQWKRVQNSSVQGRRGRTVQVRMGEEITCNVMQWEAVGCKYMWDAGQLRLGQWKAGKAVQCNVR